MEVINIDSGTRTTDTGNLRENRDSGGTIRPTSNAERSAGDNVENQFVGREIGSVTLEIPRRGRGRPAGSRNGTGSGGNGSGSGSATNRGNTTGNETEQNEVVVLDPVQANFTQEKTRKPRSSSSKVSADQLAQLVAVLFMLYAMSKPPILRQCWERDTDDCQNVAVPLANMINRSGSSRVIGVVQNLTDPITLIVALMSMVKQSLEMEKRIIATIREQQAENTINSAYQNTPATGNSGGSSKNGGNGSVGEDVAARRFDIPTGY